MRFSGIGRTALRRAEPQLAAGRELRSAGFATAPARLGDALVGVGRHLPAAHRAEFAMAVRWRETCTALLASARLDRPGASAVVRQPLAAHRAEPVFAGRRREARAAVLTFAGFAHDSISRKLRACPLAQSDTAGPSSVIS
jgi:hypothetical protein